MDTEPRYGRAAFVCPHCGVLAQQSSTVVRTLMGTAHPLGTTQCANCSQLAIWETFVDPKRLVYPPHLLGPSPNPDMPADVLSDFEEARRIAADSPRGAAALLRLAIQKVCVVLGQSGKNINSDIAELVKAGLPQLLQQSLDAVRVIGNNAVHPGELDLHDDRETVTALFGLVNIIVERMISEPKRIKEIYDALPDSARSAVTKRDA